MDLTFPKEIGARLPVALQKKLGLENDNWKWAKSQSINLRRFDEKTRAELIKVLREIPKSITLIRTLDLWAAAISGQSPAQLKPNSVRQFRDLLVEALRRVPGHRIAIHHEDRGVVQSACVDEIQYQPRTRTSYGGETPEHTWFDYWWQELGAQKSTRITFYAQDVRGYTVAEALGEKGITLENMAVRKQYLEELKLYNAVAGNVGEQYLATGIGTNDLDGNKDDEDVDRWWWRHYNMKKVRLDHSGEPAHVVIDIHKEKDTTKDERDDESMNVFFWRNVKELTPKVTKKAPRAKQDDEEGEDFSEGADEDDEDLDGTDWSVLKDDEDELVAPIYPMLACFDLKRHMRLRIHISQLTKYEYTPTLGERLVLPEDVTKLVNMLIHYSGSFTDVVKGKGGGTVILSAGPPGTGKTLTAEIYAEVMSRPLFSVQCSQLGVEPNELEETLLKTFGRAKRWNAILLLDEADVYVSKRGEDLTQNAIVGVFLRTLEYYDGVLFMTTNRADLVDDAIASRCVARIEYKVPSVKDQARIWGILSEVSGIKVEPKVIEKFAAAHPEMSGRDVKNMLKLAGMVAKETGKPITVDTLEFVKRFKPTEDVK